MEPIGEIRLRSFEKSDIDKCVDWASDDEMRVLMRPSNPAPRSREEDEAWYSRLLLDANTRIFSIEAGGAFIGVIYITRIDHRNRNALLSVMIGDKGAWDKKYGVQAVKKIADVAFNLLGLHKLFLYVASYNQRAIKAYENAGFVREGRLKEHLVHQGEYTDWVVMSLFNTDNTDLP
jgi:RimJ/RimL family protein N-acetyltransferase